MATIEPIPEVVEPERIPRSRGLGALAENSLVRFIVQAYNAARNSIAQLLRYSVDATLETLERPLLDLVGPVLDDLLDIPDLPESVRTMLARARSGEHQVGFIVLGVAVYLAVNYLGSAAFSGLAEKIRQGSYNLFKANLLDFGTWFIAARRDGKWNDTMLHELAHNGWTLDQLEAAKLVAERWPDASELMTLWRRGEISETEFNRRLIGYGVASAALPMYRALRDLIPGPSDLVRMAVREAWRDDVAQDWGYDQGYVAEFGQWMEKQGFPADWARKYWRAHWATPSIGQGFEMFHRDEITEGQLEDLLKINDLAPGWIRPLMAIARPIPGRVDRRWAFEEGEINADQLFQLYRHEGYDEDWARVLTNVTVKRAVSESKGLTRSAVEKAYKKRRLSYDEAMAMLADLAIQPEIADFYLDQVDADRADELLDMRADAVQKQFMSGLLSSDQVFERLGTLGIATDEIEASLEVWQIARDAKTKRPTRANLDKWFKQGLIDPDEYRSQMALLQYADTYTDRFLASLAIERSEAAAADEKAAREEQERIRKSRLKTDYQVDKAQLDTDIAELQTAIADAQVALIEAENERDARLARAKSVQEIAELEREYQPLFRAAESEIDVARNRIADLRVKVREVEAEQSEIRRMLAANRDIATQERLRTERLTLDVEISGLGTRIAERNVEIAKLLESIPMAETADKTAELKIRQLTLKREIEELELAQAQRSERREEIDVALQETLSVERRQELEIELADLAMGVDTLQFQIEGLQAAIQETRGDKADLERELEVEIARLPGADEAAAIRLEFTTLIDEIRLRISEFKVNVTELRLAKAQLTVEYRASE